MPSETHLLPAQLGVTVFAKTGKGREEMNRRAAALTAKQRSLLIMLDGQKRLAEIGTMLPGHEVAEIVNRLLESGLIAVEGEMKEPPPAREFSAFVVAPRPSGASGAETAKLIQIKQLMTRSAEDYLGLMAAEVVRRIDKAGDETELLSVLGHWHMALLGSKRGKAAAGVHLEQIKARFGDT